MCGSTVSSSSTPTNVAEADIRLIWLEFDRLAAHPQLASSPNLVNIFQYLLNCTVKNETDQLKEYTIAVLVLNRRDDFDPRTESIVRTQIGKLRSKLDFIYNETGTPNGIRLRLQKGSYKVHIEYLDSPSVPVQLPSSLQAAPSVLKALSELPLLIVVEPQRVIESGEASEAASQGLRSLSQQLISSLVSSGDIRIFQYVVPFSGISSQPSPQALPGLTANTYILEFLPCSTSVSPGLTVRLSHAATKEIILAVDVSAVTLRQLAAFQDLLSSRILAAIRQCKGEWTSSNKADASKFEASILAQKGWFHLQQLNRQSLNHAILEFQRAASLKRFDSTVNSGRVLSAAMAALSQNYAGTELKIVARLGLLDFSVASPELAAEREALAHIVAATFEWQWPSEKQALELTALLDPSCAVVPFFAFLVLLPLELFDPAISLLEQASSHCLTNPAIFASLGWAYLAAQNVAAAERAFREALDLEPRCQLSQEGLSRIIGTDDISHRQAHGNRFVPDSALGQALDAMGANSSFSTLQCLGVAIRNREARTLMVPFDPIFEFFRRSPHYAAFRNTMSHSSTPSPVLNMEPN